MIQLLPDSPKIVVIGSSSIDSVINASKMPQPNETVIARGYESFFGGKGANQAVGCARLGASVHFVGCVGMEPVGQQIMRHLVEEGVNVGYVHESPNSESGRAYVMAAQNKNTIVVVPAANYDLEPGHVAHAERFIEKADLVLLQLEIPMEVVEYSVNLAYRNQVKVGLYASPAVPLSENLIQRIDFIVAKASELPILFGDSDADFVMRKYVRKLFVRDNANGTQYFDGNEMKNLTKDHEHVLHTMGMGDAFTSGFAVAFCHKNSLDACVAFGNEIAHQVSLQRGSQRGLPFLRELVGGLKNDNFV